MYLPQFATSEFLNAARLNKAVTSLYSGAQDDLSVTHLAGLVEANLVTVTATGKVFTFTCASGFAGIFGNGFVARPHGTTSGVDSPVSTLDMTSVIPGTGSQLVYVVLSAVSVAETPVPVLGPPPGHPDYDPTFVPTIAFTAAFNTLAFTATTTVPDNLTFLEFGRITLTAGQTTVTPGNLLLTHQVRAGSILDKTGVAAGAYTSPSITVNDEGRITGVANVTTIPGGALLGIVTHYMPSSGTLTPPTNANFAEIECVGAGGGGGSQGFGTAMGSGGGGAYAKIYVDLSNYVMPLSYVVGAGGIGGVGATGVNNVPGTSGGLSSVKDAHGTTVVICMPGHGGTLSIAGLGGALPTLGPVIDADILIGAPGGIGQSQGGGASLGYMGAVGPTTATAFTAPSGCRGGGGGGSSDASAYSSAHGTGGGGGDGVVRIKWFS